MRNEELKDMMLHHLQQSVLDQVQPQVGWGRICFHCAFNSKLERAVGMPYPCSARHATSMGQYYPLLLRFQEPIVVGPGRQEMCSDFHPSSVVMVDKTPIGTWMPLPSGTVDE